MIKEHRSAGTGPMPVAVLRNSRKTERGAGQFLVRLAVRAAPFAVPAGRGFHEKAGPCQVENDFGPLKPQRPSPTNGRRYTRSDHLER